MTSLHLIASCIGRPLEAIRFESLYVDGVVSEIYRVVFLRFDSWLRVISSHGETRVEPVLEPALCAFEPDGEHLQYPVNDVSPEHAVGPVLGCEVLGASQIVMAGNLRCSYGFELDFGAHRLRLLCIDGESMDLNAGRSPLGDELARRPLLRVIRGGIADRAP
jgi:hypothetical protein